MVQRVKKSDAEAFLGNWKPDEDGVDRRSMPAYLPEEIVDLARTHIHKLAVDDCDYELLCDALGIGPHWKPRDHTGKGIFMGAWNNRKV